MKVIFEALEERKEQVDEAYNICRQRAIKALIYLFFLSVVCVLFNIAGAKILNAYIGFIVALALIYALSNPNIIWVALGVAAYSDKITAGDALKKLADILYAAMFAATMFLFILSTFHISRNYASIPIIYLAVIIIFLFDAVWNIKTTFSKKLLYTYTLIYLAFSIGSMISGTTYNKLVGFDPYFYLRTTEVDELLHETETQDYENRMKATAARLKNILDKLERGGSLTEAEKQFIQGVRDETTVTGMVKTTFKDWTKEKKSTPQPPPLTRERFFNRGINNLGDLKAGEYLNYWIRINEHNFRFDFNSKKGNKKLIVYFDDGDKTELWHQKLPIKGYVKCTIFAVENIEDLELIVS
jgi:hypothetical protein